MVTDELSSVAAGIGRRSIALHKGNKLFGSKGMAQADSLPAMIAGLCMNNSPNASYNSITKLQDSVRQEGKHLLREGLKKIVRRDTRSSYNHLKLSLSDDSLIFLENKLLSLLAKLLHDLPTKTHQLTARVLVLFPHDLAAAAISKATDMSSKRSSKFNLPHTKIHQIIAKELLQFPQPLQLEPKVTKFITAILEFVATEVVDIVYRWIQEAYGGTTDIIILSITRAELLIAVNSNSQLTQLFEAVQDSDRPLPNPTVTETDQNYESIIYDMTRKHREHVEDLKILIKVFRNAFQRALGENNELVSRIFGNIDFVYEEAEEFLIHVDDTKEMTNPDEDIQIGCVFSDLVEGDYLNCYLRYVENVRSRDFDSIWKQCLNTPQIQNMINDEPGFRECVTYCLPKLLLNPAFYSLRYREYCNVLKQKATHNEDCMEFKDALSCLDPLAVSVHVQLSTVPEILRHEISEYESVFRSFQQTHPQERIQQLSEKIENWEYDNFGPYVLDCLVFRTDRSIISLNSRQEELRLILLRNVLLLCKEPEKTKKDTPCKIKMRFEISKIEIKDSSNYGLELRAENDENRHKSNNSEYTLINFKIPDDKPAFLAAIYLIKYRDLLKRRLQHEENEEAKQCPLQLPPSSIYRFTEPDSDANLIFEAEGTRLSSGDTSSLMASKKLLRGATLTKLVERLTSHLSPEPNLSYYILATFRTFTNSRVLLNLLIERFNIPALPFDSKDVFCAATVFPPVTYDPTERRKLNKYRRQYVQPVQFRVLNVLKQWVENYYCDFEENKELLNSLNEFLDNAYEICGKSMKKCVEAMRKITRHSETDFIDYVDDSAPPIEAKPNNYYTINNNYETNEQSKLASSGAKPPNLVLNGLPPPVEWHTHRDPKDFDLMTLHPVEIARQLTLLESDLYRAISALDLIGYAWGQKKDSTNGFAVHFDKISYWLARTIVETQNVEERDHVISRVIDICLVMKELHNYTGLFAISLGALGNAAIVRLSMKRSSSREKKRELARLSDNNFTAYKSEFARLPLQPCVPFIGVFLTQLVQIGEGNPDYLDSDKTIINLSKRRKTWEIVCEVLRFQNVPYCLVMEGSIRSYLESIDPFKGIPKNDSVPKIDDYLFDQSLIIEPRNEELPRFPRKYSYSLKSPGVGQFTTGRQPSVDATQGRLPSSDISISPTSPRSPISPSFPVQPEPAPPPRPPKPPKNTDMHRIPPDLPPKPASILTHDRNLDGETPPLPKKNPHYRSRFGTLSVDDSNTSSSGSSSAAFHQARQQRVSGSVLERGSSAGKFGLSSYNGMPPPRSPHVNVQSPPHNYGEDNNSRRDENSAFDLFAHYRSNSGSHAR